MTFEIGLTLAVIALTLIAFIREWAAPDVIALTVLCGVVVVRSALAVRRDAAQTGYARYTVERVALFAAPPVLYAVGGVLLIGLHPAQVGLVVVAVGTILAIITTVLFSWVALVEVLR